MYSNLRNRDYTGSADDYQLAGYTLGDINMVPYDQPVFPEITPGFSQGARIYKPTSFPGDAIPYHEIIHQTGEQLDGEFLHTQASFTDPDFVAMLLPQQIENEREESKSILQPRLDLEDMIQKHVSGLLSDQKAMDQLKDRAYQLRGASEYEKREFLQNLISNQMALGASTDYERMHRSIAQYFGITPQGPTRPPVVPRPPSPPVPPGTRPPPTPPFAGADPELLALVGGTPPDPRSAIASDKILTQIAAESGGYIPDPREIFDPLTSAVVGGQTAEAITSRNLQARQARRLAALGITPEALSKLPIKEASRIARVAETDPQAAIAMLPRTEVTAPTLPVPDPAQAERILESAQAERIKREGILASSALQQLSADQAQKSHEQFVKDNPMFLTGDFDDDLEKRMAFRKAQDAAARERPEFKMYSAKASAESIGKDLKPSDKVTFVSTSSGKSRPKQEDMSIGQVFYNPRGYRVITGRGTQGGFQDASLAAYAGASIKGEPVVGRQVEYSGMRGVSQAELDKQLDLILKRK